MPFPTEVKYGKVVGRLLTAVADGNDSDDKPDAVAAVGTVTFTPSVSSVQFFGLPEPAVITPLPITCTLDSNGYVVDAQGASGVWLVATESELSTPATWYYSVKVVITGVTTPMTFDLHVEPESVTDLAMVIPPVPSVVIPESLVTTVTEARNETFAARDEVVAIGNTQDTIIASRVLDPLSETTVALEGIYAKTVDLDPELTALDADPASLFRVQQDARHAGLWVPQERAITAGTGLTGGGLLDEDMSLSVDFAASGVSSATKAVRADDARVVAVTERLAKNATQITDWNAAITTGWFKGNGATNAPDTQWWIGRVVAHLDTWVIQEIMPFTNVDFAAGNPFFTSRMRRVMQDGVWGNWYPILDSQGELDNRYRKRSFKTITDWNTATETGSYVGSGATNAPDTGAYVAEVRNMAPDYNHLIQELTGFAHGAAEQGTDSRAWRRYRYGGTWGPWVEVVSTVKETVNNILPGQSLSVSAATGVTSSGTRMLTFAGGYVLNINATTSQILPQYSGLLCTIPTGFRPVGTVFSCDTNHGRFDIQSTGAVNPQSEVPSGVTIRGQVIIAGPLA